VVVSFFFLNLPSNKYIKKKNKESNELKLAVLRSAVLIVFVFPHQPFS
jgi:hypothetical protein